MIFLRIRIFYANFKLYRTNFGKLNIHYHFNWMVILRQVLSVSDVSDNGFLHVSEQKVVNLWLYVFSGRGWWVGSFNDFILDRNRTRNSNFIWARWKTSSTANDCLVYTTSEFFWKVVEGVVVVLNSLHQFWGVSTLFSPYQLPC